MRRPQGVSKAVLANDFVAASYEEIYITNICSLERMKEVIYQFQPFRTQVTDGI